MTIRTDEAAATLAEIDGVVARVKRSRIYRTAAQITILWGGVNIVRGLLVALWPATFGPHWFLIDLFGVAATIVILRTRPTGVGRFPLRILAAFAIVYAFGWVWSNLIGHFGPREAIAFWPTLFLLGFAIAGLLFGLVLTAIGIGLAALVIAGYLWSGDGFPLYQAAVTGLGFIACGLWMRRP